MGSTVLFDGEPCSGGVFGVVDVDIDEACKGIVWGFVLLISTEILFDIAWLGCRRVHAASEENGVNEIASYPALRRSRVNVRSMDLFIIQYRTVRVGSPDYNARRMPVLYSNACSGVRLLGIVGWERSAIVTAGAVGKRNRGKDVVALESHPLLPQRIRVITYRCW